MQQFTNEYSENYHKSIVCVILLTTLNHVLMFRNINLYIIFVIFIVEIPLWKPMRFILFSIRIHYVPYKSFKKE